jgi:hypothetical protein
MKIKKMLLFMMVGFFCNVTNTEAKARNIEEWEKCVDKENTIAYKKHPELCGASSCDNDSEIQRHCGNRPINETAPMIMGIGVSPYDLVQSKAWKKKFVSITKKKYQAFVDRLAMVGDNTTLQGDWIIGEGFMPHFGGDEIAAFAINSTSGQVFAVMREKINGDYTAAGYATEIIAPTPNEEYIIHTFGFTNFYDAPPFLQKWIKEHNQ